MAEAADLPGWRDMELGAPETARLGTGRLNAACVAIPGSVHRDRSPSSAPSRGTWQAAACWFGCHGLAGKAADLRRDLRYVPHSAVTGPDSGEGELKPHGLAAEAGPRLHGESAGAWWAAQPPEKAVVFVPGTRQALFAAWDSERGVMTVHW